MERRRGTGNGPESTPRRMSRPKATCPSRTSYTHSLSSRFSFLGETSPASYQPLCLPFLTPFNTLRSHRRQAFSGMSTRSEPPLPSARLDSTRRGWRTYDGWWHAACRSRRTSILISNTVAASTALGPSSPTVAFSRLASVLLQQVRPLTWMEVYMCMAVSDDDLLPFLGLLVSRHTRHRHRPGRRSRRPNKRPCTDHASGTRRPPVGGGGPPSAISSIAHVVDSGDDGR
ncbi:hypothetical protein C8F01DRAFT_147011 [Mycena amicta]|nr:hypothetical protein C8F01DRAFT_147011 [Mycena amicta]